MTSEEEKSDSPTSNIPADPGAGKVGRVDPPPSSRPPRGVRLWKVLLLLVIVALAFAAGARWSIPLKAVYERIAAVEESAPVPKQEGPVQYYTCGMHPWVILPHPGNCPICGMTLVPIDASRFSSQVTIDPLMVQNIGVRIEPVTQGPLVKTIRTVGMVDYNETTVRDISIKVGGWIDKLFVNYLGAHVKKGDPLFAIYSPELYAAQEEYLLALNGSGRAGSAVTPGGVSNAQSLLDSATTKLRYDDITDEQIAQLRKDGKPSKTMTLLSPFEGVVIAKDVNEGMKVDPGMQIFRIADLSKVWVMVTLYEYQLPYVEVGQKAVMTLPYVPGQTFEGRVIYIYPYLERKVRQVNVRLEFENPTGLLKPGMYASVELRNELAARRTLVPSSAILNTGERQVAFVSLGEGRFEPRNVTLGLETQGDMYEVLDGLKPGEMVVTSAQFLLDSEAKIRESLARMISGNEASQQKAVAAGVGQSELHTLPEAFSTELINMLNAYLAVGHDLYSDQVTDLTARGRLIAALADRISSITLPDHPTFWQNHPEIATIGGKGTELSVANDLAAARESFADLSIALSKLLKATGVPPSFKIPLQELHCPMYRTGQGGNVWLQTDEEVENPFFGVHSPMPHCFDKRHVLPVTGQAPAEPSSQGESPAPLSQVAAPSDMSILAKNHEHSSEIDTLTSSYLALATALSQDRTDGVSTNLMALRTAAQAIKSGVGNAGVSDLSQAVIKAAQFEPETIQDIRDHLKPLSRAVIDLIKAQPPDASPSVGALYEMYCPMKKAYWLQMTEETANPYYGSVMATCGEVKDVMTLHHPGTGEKGSKP